MFASGKVLLPDQRSVSVGTAADLRFLQLDVRDHMERGLDDDAEHFHGGLPDFPEWLRVALFLLAIALASCTKCSRVPLQHRGPSNLRDVLVLVVLSQQSWLVQLLYRRNCSPKSRAGSLRASAACQSQRLGP